jgi:ribosomal-protein-serine acetyltransferase
MFELVLDRDLKVRTFHPDDSVELFALLERDRERLRPWIHPSSLPETPPAARTFAIECYFNSFDDPMAVLDSPYFQEVGKYFRGFEDPQMELGIWLRGRLVGEVSLSFFAKERTTAEFGYWIGGDQEGRGIVTRCVMALLEYAIDRLQMDRFLIGCAASNRRSEAVARRLGFRLQAVIPDGEVVGEFVYDRRVYALTAREWRARLRSEV